MAKTPHIIISLVDSYKMEVPEEDSPEQLVTMSASVAISSLPQDATAVLDQYLHPTPQKITIRLRSIGSAPMLKQQVYRISSEQKFSSLVKFIRRQLKVPANESIFCYINSAFAPSLDETIGNLYQVSNACFFYSVLYEFSTNSRALQLMAS